MPLTTLIVKERYELEGNFFDGKVVGELSAVYEPTPGARCRPGSFRLCLFTNLKRVGKGGAPQSTVILVSDDDKHFTPQVSGSYIKVIKAPEYENPVCG